MDGLTDFLEDKGQVQIPDLDWAVINLEDKKNLPSQFPVQIIPQLQEAWSHEPSMMKIIPCVDKEEIVIKKQASEEEIGGVVATAKKEMMLGISGKALADKLASLYHPDLLEASKPQLRKVAEEQGLLGNVYVDMSVFASCEEASRILGNNKIRLAKYVVGNPSRQCCSSHGSGFCKDLKKKVVASVEYDAALLEEYTTHLRVAQILSPSEVLSSKEDLRSSLFRVKEEIVRPTHRQASSQSYAEDYESAKKAFDAQIESKTALASNQAKVAKEAEVRPILAFIQNEMLKGKIGSSLKEVIETRYSADIIAKYASYIQKMASLQGLIGNVYVDISLYNTADDAIKAIKNASTGPLYLIQSDKKGDFDGTLERVAKVTGCLELPRDGKIDTKIASSYIDDLQFTSRLSSDNAIGFKKSLESGENPLQILREAFISSLSHKTEQREGGVKGYFHQMSSKKNINRDSLRQAAYQALSAGISLDKVESKVASVVPTTEAIGLVRDVLSQVKEIDANCLTNCTSEKYHLNRQASLIAQSKCTGCVYRNCSSCIQTGLTFKMASDDEASMIKIDPKTKKVTLAENPDETRCDMRQEYDMSDSYGSGSNIALDKMSKEASLDFDLESDGMDLG